MTTIFSKRIGPVLIGLAILSSCSRPVAYFQRSPAEPSSQTPTVIVNTSASVVEAPAELLTTTMATTTPVDAYVRYDSKGTTHKNLNRRMVRVQHMLASTHETLIPKASNAPHKLNLVERLMLKKMNKQISRQLAPNHPEKALVNRGHLIGGAVLLIGGLLLLILGTGTVAFIGLIVALVGALGVIFGLLGLDS